jgi:uncharacterized protein
MSETEQASGLVTSAPEVTAPPRFWPTGNLWVSLPEIDLTDGSVGSLGVLHERAAGLVQAHGGPDGLLRPAVTIDGEPVPIEPQWTRDGDWIPHLRQQAGDVAIDAWYLTPHRERGAAFRLSLRNTGPRTIRAELGWIGGWASGSVAHLRAKPLTGELTVRDDQWTGSRVVTLSAGLPVVALGLQAGNGVSLGPQSPAGTAVAGWQALRAGDVPAGGELTADVYIGVAPEPDGAAVTALHLRRRGFDALLASTLDWLAARALVFAARQVPAGLGESVNCNLFFNYNFAQGDCLDTGRPVIVTSRSPHYYVCAAFWSRDAFCWTFPALLLTDPERARTVLVSSLAAAGDLLADHALYLNGTPLYPGFELDQAAAPVIAIWRYVAATGDRTVLTEPAVVRALRGLPELVRPWRHPDWELYGTFLLPTDDPTDFPYVATGNAVLACAFDATAALAETGAADLGSRAGWLRERAAKIRAELTGRLVTPGPHGPMWAWACDADGRAEIRDEPPLGLRTLPYWGLCAESDPVQVATRRWLTDGYRFHYPGAFPGAGAPHFPHPSGFDLANRLLDGDDSLGDPLAALAATPMDQGLACESWDPDTGVVATGAAMASMAGLLAWTAWARLTGHRRWDQPIRR